MSPCQPSFNSKNKRNRFNLLDDDDDDFNIFFTISNLI